MPLQARRLRALLRPPPVVERQAPRAHRDGSAQLRPDARGVPRRMGDEVLERLRVAWIAETPVHSLQRLPLAVPEQAVDVLRGRVPLRLAAEARTELIKALAQSSRQRARGLSSREQRTERRAPVQAKSLRSVPANLTM